MLAILPGATPLLTLAVVLCAGVAGGALARLAHLPAVTGQIVAGVCLGPSVLSVFQVEQIHALEPITNFALGLIALAVGTHLQLRRLLNARKRLLLLLGFEAFLTPGIVYGLCRLVPSCDPALALLLAAISVSTAPATVLALVKESRSKGVFVKTLMAGVALNNIACICLFELAHLAARSLLASGESGDTLTLVSAPLFQLGASILLGGLTGSGLVLATWRELRPERLATATLITILLTAGIADAFGVSALLACLFCGMTLANLAPAKEEACQAAFANLETAILAAFFTLAGLELDFGYLAPGGVLIALVLGGRFLGKLASANLAMRFAGATDRVRRWLGLALIPQAGVAVGLLVVAQEDPVLAPISEILLAVGLSVVTLNEIVGPILTRTALARSGDYGKDRARLIDFIHEEHIVVGLEAETKEQAIRKLTDILAKTSGTRVDRGALLRSVLERENEVSTCVGEGLAIPHGVLMGSDDIAGIMGLSRTGLSIETPDDIPVHCMILLATPPNQRERHLEVLAAFARSIGSDRSVQRRLFDATSPAHAYDILHAEEFESFNYFLDED